MLNIIGTYICIMSEPWFCIRILPTQFENLLYKKRFFTYQKCILRYFTYIWNFILLGTTIL